MRNLRLETLTQNPQLLKVYVSSKYWGRDGAKAPVSPVIEECIQYKPGLFGLGGIHRLCEFYFDPMRDSGLTEELSFVVSDYDMYKDFGTGEPEGGLYNSEGYARGLRGKEKLEDFLKNGGCLAGLIGQAYQSWTLNDGIVDIALAMAQRRSDRAIPDECASCAAKLLIQEITTQMQALAEGK